MSRVMKLKKSTFLIVPALAMGLFALTGCSALSSIMGGNSAPVRDAESGDIVEENENTDVFSIRVGDCLNTDETLSEETTSVPVVPCSEPHADEVYYSFLIDEPSFPGNDEVIRMADEGCLAEFESFIGTPWADSEIDYWPMYPTEGSWKNGDREVLCMVWDPTGDTVGTLKDSRR
ncbi:MAG: hypothetical protein D3X82_09295 [Candidatus Leucobacter sulfamidivorax]|nr:hypothetical protein [Candidatus Leucobacter sulfamidivorax]